MSKSINHRAEAEKHLAMAAHTLSVAPEDICIADTAAVIGHGYATLANNTVNDDLRDANDRLRTQLHAMRRWVSGHIAHALVTPDIERWKAAVDLAKGLDSADLNIDKDVDEHLADDGHSPRTAWTIPARIEDAGRWGPGVTAIQAASNVVALHLAEALLEGKSEEVRNWARNLAYELKREGFDLTADIGQHIQGMALGPDPSEPPF